jgi:hypothetical protein
VSFALRWDEAADANATGRGTARAEEPEGEAAVGCRGPRLSQGQARFARRKRPLRQLGVGQHGRKTDRIDAQTLALALERGHTPKAHVLSPHRRQLRLHLQVRRGLVETRAQYITTIRGLVRASGESLDSCSSTNFLELLKQTTLKESTRALVEPLAQILEKLNEQIALTEAKLLELCAQESAIERLTTVPGISQPDHGGGLRLGHR